MDEGLTNTPERGGHGGSKSGHVPVLLKEAIDFLAIKRGGTYIDATVGLGGHSLEIAKRLGAPGHLIGLDKDPAALDEARIRLISSGGEGWPEVSLLHGSFAEIGERFGAASADGLLADLGVSSLQLDTPSRGFSFQADGPSGYADEYAPGLTAEQVVNQADEGTRQSDLRIRRGKEVAENRQSHCPGAADYEQRRNWPGWYRLRPRDESGGTKFIPRPGPFKLFEFM